MLNFSIYTIVFLWRKWFSNPDMSHKWVYHHFLHTNTLTVDLKDGRLLAVHMVQTNYCVTHKTSIHWHTARVDEVFHDVKGWYTASLLSGLQLGQQEADHLMSKSISYTQWQGVTTCTHCIDHQLLATPQIRAVSWIRATPN